jgi:dihydropteroate synthase
VWRALRLRALADSPDAFGQLLASAEARTDAEWQASMEPMPTRAQLLAEDAGTAIGMTVALIDAADPARAHLYAMWVTPEARRRQVGRRLVHAALDWARAKGVREVELRATATNAAAYQLYLATGFVDTGRREPLREGSSIEAHVLVARLPRVLVMGVVNTTPDSFSDGGRYLDPAAAVAHGTQLLRDGADLLDIGGEATNPHTTPITADDELARVLPVIEQLAATGARISIDTTKARVAEAAVAAGATVVNDVSGGLFDPDMVRTVITLAAGGNLTYIAGHLRGRTLEEVFAAEAPVGWRRVAAELADRLAVFPPSVVERIWVDPGIGFGKGSEPEGNLELLRHAGDIAKELGRPVVVGPSRKRFLRKLLGPGPDADPLLLDVASVAACLGAVRSGALVVRTHNVALLRAALAVYTKL